VVCSSIPRPARPPIGPTSIDTRFPEGAILNQSPRHHQAGFRMRAGEGTPVLTTAHVGFRPALECHRALQGRGDPSPRPLEGRRGRGVRDARLGRMVQWQPPAGAARLRAADRVRGGVLPSKRVATRKRLRRIDAEPRSGVGMSPRPGGFGVGMLSVHRSSEAEVLT